MLLVEDDRLTARAVMRVLRGAAPSVEVVHVTTKRAGLQLVCGREDWRLIVVDIQLGADPHAGLDILAAAAKHAPDVPRAALTAHMDPFVIDRAASLGASFLLKAGKQPMGALAVCARSALTARAANPDHAARADAYGRRLRLRRRMARVQVVGTLARGRQPAHDRRHA